MQIITSHINADFDTLASMLAAKKLYPDAILVFPGSLEKNLRDFFEKPISRIFEIEKIKNIDLTKIERLIIVDVRHKKGIGRFAEIVDKPGIDIHIYDHHQKSPDDIHGSAEFILPYGSTTTILVHLIKEKNIEITPDEATIMMLGIYEDTGSLTFISTTEKDYEAAAFLLSKGANLNIVSDMIKTELTKEQVSLLNDLLESMAAYVIDGIEVVIAEASSDTYMGDIAVLVHRLKDIENINCLFVLVQMEDRIHLIARSRIKEVNVGEIARELGGGGHPTAAAATLKGMTIVQAKEELTAILKNKIAPKHFAKDMMSAPPITISFDSTFGNARDLLVRYGINAMPVMKGETLTGIITRQVIEKAVYHGLEYLSVSEYMTTDFKTVGPDASFEQVQDAVIGYHQRLLPVVEDNKLIGVISRTDILRLLHQDIKEKPYAEQEWHARKHKFLAKLMQDKLPEKVFKILRNIGNTADDMGFKAYAVGGFVRDLIMRCENLDIDIVIEGDGIKFANEFVLKFKCKVKTHERFNTAVIVFPDGFKLDIATARLEYYEKPGSLPTVELSSIKLDLYRRDFTINTLAIALNPKNFGELKDFFGAERDIKEKAVRVLHNLSFVEDPTRVFRAIRFEQKFGFKISKHTQNLIKNAVKLDIFRRISGKRVLEEIKAILGEETYISAIKRMKELDILKFIHPDIVIDKPAETLLEKGDAVISWHRLLYLDEKIEKWLVIFLLLTDKLKDEDFISLCKNMAIEGRHRSKVANARHDAITALNNIQAQRDLKGSEVYKILKPLPMENILYIMAKARIEDVKKTISNFITHLKDCKTILSGEDLKNMGIKEGPRYSEIFNKLLEKRLDNEIKTKEGEEAFVRDLLKKGIG
ncbi:MAG: CBS domain-containing protein [Deltaproteobacteria bacterium]|nr:CBS domain-containing protein [Deltaproteobacteria bacterium]